MGRICGKERPWDTQSKEWEACPQWEAALMGFPALTIEHCLEQELMLYMNVKLNLWFLHPPHFLELIFWDFGAFYLQAIVLFAFSFLGHSTRGE